MTTLSEPADRLASRFRGELIRPEDEGYEAARRVWNATIDRRPALIARAAGSADIVAAVEVARTVDMPISIRGGGHSAAGFAVADDALMLDLSGMKAIRVDPHTRTAVAEPGVTWREFDATTGAFGLATTGGAVSSTGIAGLTLGGGIGWLDRVCGLTCDNLLGAEVVTADGQILHADARQHPDLFWALRGGGGNFGVVASFRYRLHPVSQVVGGLLGFPGEQAVEVLRAYRDLTADAPDRLTANAALLTAPPAAFLPAGLHGRPMVGVIPVYVGAPDEAQPLLRPLRALRPAVDMVVPRSYADLQRQTDAFSPTGMHHYTTAEWLRELDDATIESLVAVAGAATSPYSIISVKRMGGATARVPGDATPFAYRHAAYNVEIHAQWPAGGGPGPHVAWTRTARHAVRRASAGGGYVNFLEPGQGGDRIRAAYGTNYPRLAEVKATYDPDNLFHLNQNVPPAPAASSLRRH